MYARFQHVISLVRASAHGDAVSVAYRFCGTQRERFSESGEGLGLLGSRTDTSFATLMKNATITREPVSPTHRAPLPHEQARIDAEL
jgi:hypothetical protein